MMPPIYVELVECEQCLKKHFVEVWRARDGTWKQKCHGPDLALETEKTFAKRSGKGFKIYKTKKIGLPTAAIVDRDTHIKELQIDF